EMGGPFISSYLLKFPDHYTNCMFKVIFWKQYLKVLLPVDSENTAIVDNEDDTVLLNNVGGNIVEVSPVHDWIYRPSFFTSYCLVDFLKCTDKHKVRKK
ncbi:hypothetical protein PUNSTDRAFT_34207, partial [Punctularia strigosozonata HHB-11173 SS5]|uniref:uncharacterized protein n=1 Tax=Punctularia strigosozonata (strain HHB-11173) TaxID=741275 RepID=UPI000441827A